MFNRITSPDGDYIMKITVNDFAIRPFAQKDTEQVVNLWRDCGLLFPGNDPYNDIRLKTAFQPEFFLVGFYGEEIAATLMAGYDGHRGWLNYLGVLPGYQRLGLGKRMIHHAIDLLKSFECPKINLQVRNTNTGVIEFYKKIGFLEHEVSSMQLRL
jgi:ribosomal protein S18 acetylase RimI-like enzyme